MLNRIPFLLIACSTTIAAMPFQLANAQPADNRPNVLFIAIDDLNDWIGVLGGHPQAQTPNIDRLAARGMLFSNCHCAAPACNPSRVALMTGMRPSTTGIYINPQPWRPALPNAVTLSQHFMQNGYTAKGAGKIYHGAYPDPASWDEYFPSKTQDRPQDPRPNRHFNGIKNSRHFDWGPVDVADEQMGDHKVVDWVSGQLNKSHTKPLFLACGIYRPHLPWYVPTKYFDRYPLDEIQLPNVLKYDLNDVPKLGIAMAKPNRDHHRVVSHRQWEAAVQGYLASIAFADYQVGRLLDAFDRSPMANNTIVVLWTDHGWHLGEKHHWRKFALWERATRTPLIMVAPAVTGANQQCDQPVNLLDLYPTLLQLCDLPNRAELEGNDLTPLLKNPAADWQHASLTTHGRNNHAVRSQRYRYIRYKDGSEELYDHASDSNEWNNLADDRMYAPIKQRLAMFLPTKNLPPAPQGR